VYFGWHGPRHRRPPDSKGEHEEEDKGDTCPSRRRVRIPLSSVFPYDSGNDKVRDSVSDGSEDEWRLAADSVKQEESRASGYHLGNVENTRHGDLHLGVKAKLTKESGRVVNELEVSGSSLHHELSETLTALMPWNCWNTMSMIPTIVRLMMPGLNMSAQAIASNFRSDANVPP
jgi:hypothetical protein